MQHYLVPVDLEENTCRKWVLSCVHENFQDAKTKDVSIEETFMNDRHKL